MVHVVWVRSRQNIKQTRRPFGLCAGDFVVPDDFDAPLPADVLDAFMNPRKPIFPDSARVTGSLPWW